MLSKRSYQDLSYYFNQSLSWLEDLGIRVKNSRFEKIKRDVIDLVAVAKNKNLGRFSNEDDYHSGIYSLIEAADLVDIYEVYKNKKVRSNLLKTLSVAVKGPKAGDDETSDNNKARNALAELSWGALLEKSNYVTSHEYYPDILQLLKNHNNNSIIWEVKRPLSIKKLNKRLKDGSSQIINSLSGKVDVGNTNPIGGCIVVFVENILGTHRAIVVGSDNNRMDELVKNELQNWWEINKPDSNSYWKPGVLGVVLWWRLVGTNISNSHNSLFINWNQRLLHCFNTNDNKSEIKQIKNIIDSSVRFKQ